MGVKLTVTDPDNKDKAPWWWRRRVGMTPFYLGFASALAAYSSFLLSAAQTFALLVVVCAAGLWGAQQKWGRKKDRAMRNFVWVVIAAFATFVGAVRADVLDYGWVLVALAIGVLGLGGFWWKDAWNQKRVKIERDVERWPGLAKKLSMEKVIRGPEQTTETGRKWMFWWHPGDFTLGAFKGRARDLESALRIPDGRIRFENVFEAPGMKNPNAIIVTENTDSPMLKGSVKFGKPTMRVFTDPMFIGPREDNTRHEVTWFHPDFGGMHTLAAGSTGSGKSGLYHLIMAESAYCPDLVRWGIDAKGGMALRPWASIFDWMVTDVDSGEVFWMLTGLHKILKARSEYAAEQGWECWEPSAEHPVLLLVIDEAAEVFGIDQFDMNSLSASIARMGRAAGVLLLIATQHPTNEAIGSTQLTKNLRRRFCFSVEDDHAQRIVIPKSSGRFDASDIPIGPEFVGTYYSSEGGQICDLSGRVRHVTKHDIYRLVMEIGAPGSPVAAPGLDVMSEKVATESTVDDDTGESWYANRRIYTIKDVIKPKDWVDDDDTAGERIDTGAPGAEGAPVYPVMPSMVPVHGAPVNPSATPTPKHNQAAAPEPPDAPADPDALPWREDDPVMDLNAIVEPRTEEERASLAAAAAQYAASYAEETVTPERAQILLDALLAQAPDEGIAIVDMRKTLPRSPSWYSEELRKRLVAVPAKAEKVGHRYRTPGRKLASVSAGSGE